VNIKFSETPFRLGVSGGVGVATSTASRSGFLARRSHGYPGFLPILAARLLACEAGAGSVPIRFSLLETTRADSALLAGLSN
jgi:hypothetical protein